MGRRVDMQRRSSDFPTTDRRQTRSRYRRVSILPWRCLPYELLVHSLGVDEAYLLVLLRQRASQHVRRTLGKSVRGHAFYGRKLTPRQAAGILGNLDGSMGIAGWRWLFIIEGVITIGVAISAGFILPDYPATTKWLNEEERNFASWRLMVDINESDDTQSRSIWEGVKLCVTDYRLYLFVLTQHLSILSQTFQYFFPSIVQTLGYGKIETLLLTVPGMLKSHHCTVLPATILTSQPSLVRNLPHLHRRNLVRRYHWRPQPAHLRPHALCCGRQRHRRRHHRRGSPLLRHVPRKASPSSNPRLFLTD